MYLGYTFWRNVVYELVMLVINHMYLCNEQAYTIVSISEEIRTTVLGEIFNMEQEIYNADDCF